jgi:hypothetical protein
MPIDYFNNGEDRLLFKIRELLKTAFVDYSNVAETLNRDYREPGPLLAISSNVYS